MKRFLVLVAFVSSVSFADTNTVDLTTIENLLTSLESNISSIEHQTADPGVTLKGYVSSIRQFITSISHQLTRPENSLHESSILDYMYNTLVASDNKLSSVSASMSSISVDISENKLLLESVLTELETCNSWLYGIESLLSNIERYTSSLPRIEAYQQSLALIVSNINNIVSDIGVTVNFPSPFNVHVDNFSDVNFSPVWDWQNKYIHGTGEPSSETLVWQNSLDLTDNRSTRFRLFPDMHNDVSFASWAAMLYKGLDNGFESLSSSGVRSVLLLNSISNINAQIYNLLSGLSPNTNLVATTDEQTEAASALRAEKLTTDSLTSEISSIDYTPNIYSESIPNIDSRPRLSGIVSAHDSLSESSGFDLGLSGFFQTATDMGYTDFEHPDTTVTIDMRPANDVCIAVRQVVLLIFWIITIFLGAKLCLVVYSLYQTIWVSLMSSDSDVGAGQTVNTINYMRHILP